MRERRGKGCGVAWLVVKSKACGVVIRLQVCLPTFGWMDDDDDDEAACGC